MLPAIFSYSFNEGTAGYKTLLLSRLAAVLLIILYCCFLFFQLVTHASFFEAQDDEEEDEEKEKLSTSMALATIIISTILIGISAEYLVSSIDGISKNWGISETFIGMIVIKFNI
jgi:Ca2+:H+ antiporter